MFDVRRTSLSRLDCLQLDGACEPSQTMPWKITMSSTWTRQKWSATDQMDKRSTWDQENTNVRE